MLKARIKMKKLSDFLKDAAAKNVLKEKARSRARSKMLCLLISAQAVLCVCTLLVSSQINTPLTAKSNCFSSSERPLSPSLKSYVLNEDSLTFQYINRTVNASSRVVRVTILAELENTKSEGVDSFSLILPAYEHRKLGKIDIRAINNSKNHVKRIHAHKLDFSEDSETSDSSFADKPPQSITMNENVRFSDEQDRRDEEYDKMYDLEFLSESAGVCKIVKQCRLTCTPALFSVFLNNKIQHNETFAFKLTYYLGDAYTTFPTHITLLDNQYVIFMSHSLWLSPYPSKKQISFFVFPNNAMLNMQSLMHLQLDNKGLKKVSDKMLSTRLYTDVDRYSIGEFLTFHFMLQNHLGYFINVERHIDVSHWGDVVIREKYQLHNHAAKLKGEFSRVDFSLLTGHILGRIKKSQNWPDSSILFYLDAILPPYAHSIEYFDEIGNISSSYASRRSVGLHQSYTALQIEPRFPLMGDWRTDFRLEYNIPLHTALSIDKNTNTHVLNVTFGHPFKGIYAQHLLNKIALPPGARNIRVITPRQIDVNTTKTVYKWLDIFDGRSALYLHSFGFYSPPKDLLEYKIQIIYDFSSSIYDLHKFFVVFIIFFISFLIYIFGRRVNFRICSQEEAVQQDYITFKRSIIQHILELFEDLVHSNDDLESEIQDFLKTPNKKRLQSNADKWRSSADQIIQKFLGYSSLLSEDTSIHQIFDLFNNFIEFIKSFINAEKIDSFSEGSDGLSSQSVKDIKNFLKAYQSNVSKFSMQLVLLCDIIKKDKTN